MRLELVHPMVIHFPIVFAISLFALDSFALVRGQSLSARSPFGKASAVLAIAAGISAGIAFVFGDRAYDIALAVGKVPHAVLETHQDLGMMTALALGGWAVVRALAAWQSIEFGGLGRLIVVAVQGVLVVVVLATAWFGGQLVYDHGVAVVIQSGT